MSLPIRKLDLDRIANLALCGLVDSDGVDVFDRYARLAATVVGTSMAAVSFQDGEKIWCKSVIGLKSFDITGCGAFCGQAMLADRALLVVDAARDPRFADAASVRGEPGVRFYLGAPLRMPGGQRIGAVSTFEAAPRTATPEMVARLVDLADAVVNTIRLYQTMQEVTTLALSDPLTGLANRIHLYQVLTAAIDASRVTWRPLTLLYIDCDRFKALNDNFGHIAGDQMLQSLARLLRDELRAGELATRLGGDEFAVVMPDTGAQAARAAADRIRASGAAMMASQGWPTTLSIGVVTFLSAPATIEIALAQADRAMYGAKQSGGDRVHCMVAGDAPDLLAAEPLFSPALGFGPALTYGKTLS